jgi:citrate lyase subunit beta/citryl-CoA lyase
LHKKRTDRSFTLPRTWLFAPGDRPDRVAKALDSKSDAVVVDLEDAVAQSSKVAARQLLRETLLGKDRTNVFVRINGAATEWFSGDIAALHGVPLAGIVLPKASSARDVQRAHDVLRDVATGRWIVPLIETAEGVREAFHIAAASASVLSVAFGGGDYCLDMDLAWPTGDQLPFLVPRVTIAQAARAANLSGAIDTPNPRIQDAEQFAAEAAVAASLGFRAKFAIHPSQLDAIVSAFTPTAQDVDRARHIDAAFTASEVAGNAAVMFEGAFVDYPIALRARAVIERAERSVNVGTGPTVYADSG